METVGVIGGGQMGSQIAALAAMAGYETHVYDSDSENLKSKIKFTEDNLLNLIDKGRYEKSKLDNFKEHLHLIFLIYFQIFLILYLVFQQQLLQPNQHPLLHQNHHLYFPLRFCLFSFCQLKAVV